MEIRAQMADIATLDVDAIVNATNESLLGGRGGDYVRGQGFGLG